MHSSKPVRNNGRENGTRFYGAYKKKCSQHSVFHVVDTKCSIIQIISQFILFDTKKMRKNNKSIFLILILTLKFSIRDHCMLFYKSLPGIVLFLIIIYIFICFVYMNVRFSMKTNCSIILHNVIQISL